MSVLNVVVVQGKTKHAVGIPADGTFGDIKNGIKELAGIEPSSQKLIFKGKERKDTEAVAAAGIKEKDKLMLMLSEQGHKEAAAALAKQEQEAQKRLRSEALSLKQAHKEGELPAGAASSAPSVEVLEGEGVKEEGAFLVHVTKGKTKCTVAASADSTFGDVKAQVEKLIKIPARHQRIIFKGKQRGDAEVLRAAGASASGARMILMQSEGQHKVDEEMEIMRDAEEELVEVEARAAKLRSQCEHGLLDPTDITVKAGLCYEAVERLTDNISYVVRADGAGKSREGMQARIDAVRDLLEGLRDKYVLGQLKR